MKLIYIGPDVQVGHGVPLPEGYPRRDHDEPDPAKAKEKVKSGFYELVKPEKEPVSPKAKEGED